MDTQARNDSDTLGYGTDVATGAVSGGTDEGAQRLQDATSGLVEQAVSAAETRVSGRVSAASDTLQNAAHAIRQSGQNLREQEQPQVATLADTAAEQVERFAGYLQGRDARQLVGDVEDFARREPVLFVTGGLALGLLAARLLKSSSGGSGGGSAIGGYSRSRYGRTSIGRYDLEADYSRPTV